MMQGKIAESRTASPMGSSTAVSRRGFVTGAAGVAAGAVAIASGAGTALAEAPSWTDAYADAEPMAWLGAEPQIDEGSIADTLECDILVVGAGTAGLFAACTAAEEGVSVICIEKNEESSGIRGTLGAIGTKYQLADDVRIDINQICHDMEAAMASNVNPRLLRLWARESAETVEWYGDLCEAAGRTVTYCSDADLEPGETVYRHWPTGHAVVTEDGRTAEDAEVLLDYFAKQGGDLRYSVTMVKLEKNADGRVTGAIAADAAGSYLRINAVKGVIVATGGYGRNDQMMAQLQPETCKMFSSNSALPGTDGDGIKACLWVGAAFDDVHTSMLFDRCPLLPDELAGQQMNSNMFWMASQPWLKVNLAGERFCNESEPYDATLHASLHQPGHTYATLWDANYVDQIYQFKTQGCSRMFPFANGAPVSAINLEIAQAMNEGLLAQGYIQQADTIEELAEKLNIPADALVATVERYNALVAAGVDEDFGKESFRMAPVDTPPFYGVRQTGYLLCTMDGIRIDENMNALDTDGNPIAGLYVCGNDSGSYFANTYPDLIPGAAAGRSATFARRAAKIACSQ